MKKCVLYPFSEKSIVLYNQLLEQKNDIEIVSVVAPKAWTLNILEDEIISNSIKRHKISSDFYNELKKGDWIIFLSCSKVELIYSDIKSKIASCIKKGKNIYCIFPLNAEDKKYFVEYAQMYNVEFKQYKEETDIWEKRYYDKERKMYKPDAILVGIGKTIDKLETTYSTYNIMNRYKKIGYRVAIISANENLCFLGKSFYKYPEKFLTNELSEDEKVLYFNRFLKYVDYSFHPEIIIVEFPEQMMRYTEECIGEFGVQTYIVSQAVNFDYFILVSDINNYDMQLLNTYYKYRFGLEIDAIVMSNMVVDFSCSLEDKEIITYFLNREDVEAFIIEFEKEFSYYIINASIKSQYKDLVEESIKALC